MFLGCSGTTSLGGKWVFFISCLVPVCVSTSLRSARRGAVALYWQHVSLQRSHGVRRLTHDLLGFEPSKRRDKVLWVGVKVPRSFTKSTSTSASCGLNQLLVHSSAPKKVNRAARGVRSTTIAAASTARGQNSPYDTRQLVSRGTCLEGLSAARALRRRASETDSAVARRAARWP